MTDSAWIPLFKMWVFLGVCSSSLHVFVDLRKTYDHIPPRVLCPVLMEYGAPGCCCESAGSYIMRATLGTESNMSSVAVGLCWGSSLSTILCVKSTDGSEDTAGLRRVCQIQELHRTLNSEAMVLCWKMVDCPLQIGSETLPEAKDFRYIRVLFRSDGKIKCVMDKQLGVMLAVMQALYQTVVVKRELRQKATSQIHLSIYIPTLIYGH